MARSFSSLIDPKEDRITFRSVITADVIPWLLSTGAVVLLYLGVVLMAQEAIASQDNSFEIATATASSQLFLMAGLILLGVIMARRSYRDVTTWAIGIGLILFFARPSWHSLASQIFLNSILPAMVALIGVLAAGRIITFLYTRYVAKLDTVKMDINAFVTYGALVIGASFLMLPL